jgi:L-fuconolactonase
VLEAFSPKRLMFGSDWPVCLAATFYRRWLDLVRHWAAGLSESERDGLMSGTAVEACGL